MTKERLILAFFAIVAGLFVASSLFYFYGQRTTISDDNPSPTITQQANTANATFTIDSPDNESVTTEKSVEIKGKAVANAVIAISTDSQDYVVRAKDDGSYSQKVDLGPNVNTITITSVPDSGTSETKTLTVTSTQEEF